MERNLISEIKQLRNDITPRPEWITSSRADLLRRITNDQTQEHVSLGVGSYFGLFLQTIRQRAFEPAVVMSSVLATFLISSFTVNAAFYSLPGDVLYPMKLTLERTHVALVTDQQKQVELRIEFAEKRVAELDRVVSQTNIGPEEKKRQVEAIAKEFKNNVSSVGQHVAKLNQQKQASGGVFEASSMMIALTASAKTEELAKTFDQKVDGLPESDRTDVKQIVAEVIESAQQTTQSAQELLQTAEEQQGTVEGAETGEVLQATTTADINVQIQTGAGEDVSEKSETTAEVIN